MICWKKKQPKRVTCHTLDYHRNKNKTPSKHTSHYLWRRNRNEKIIYLKFKPQHVCCAPPLFYFFIFVLPLGATPAVFLVSGWWGILLWDHGLDFRDRLLWEFNKNQSKQPISYPSTEMEIIKNASVDWSVQNRLLCFEIQQRFQVLYRM